MTPEARKKIEAEFPMRNSPKAIRFNNSQYAKRDIAKLGYSIAMQEMKGLIEQAYKDGVHFRDSAEKEYPVIDGHISANDYALRDFNVSDYLPQPTK